MSNTNSKIVNQENNEAPSKEKPKNNKKTVKLTDEMLVSCKSTCPNLFFKTKDNSSILWENAGDVRELTVRELREMKSTQQRFFTDQWIILLGLDESEEEVLVAEDIYKALGLTRHFENIIDISKIREIIKWENEEIPTKIKLMSPGLKENLLAALNKSIKNGTLDSIRKIKAFEEALGCELVSIK